MCELPLRYDKENDNREINFNKGGVKRFFSEPFEGYLFSHADKKFNGKNSSMHESR
jgi:hypothetical protein